MKVCVPSLIVLGGAAVCFAAVDGLLVLLVWDRVLAETGVGMSVFEEMEDFSFLSPHFCRPLRSSLGMVLSNANGTKVRYDHRRYR